MLQAHVRAFQKRASPKVSWQSVATHIILVALELCFKRLLRTFLSIHIFFLINKIIGWLWRCLGWDYNVIRYNHEPQGCTMLIRLLLL